MKFCLLALFGHNEGVSFLEIARLDLVRANRTDTTGGSKNYS